MGLCLALVCQQPPACDTHTHRSDAHAAVATRQRDDESEADSEEAVTDQKERHCVDGNDAIWEKGPVGM